MVIKAIIFDCFGVLVSSARNLMYNDYPQHRTAINDIAHQVDYGMISRRQTNEMISEVIGLTPAEIEAKYWGGSVRDESAINWVRELKLSGEYKIGFLSNIAHGWVDSYISVSERKELFDAEVESGDVGMVKPEVMIYELMAGRLGVKPSECIMIDDKSENIDGAISAGMQGVLFITTNQARDELGRLLEQDRA